MPWRIGMRKQADEGLVAGLQRRSFHRDAADRIRAVADDDGDAGPRRGAQAIGHGVDEGVDARADILDVDHQHVDQRQHLGGRLARLAVEREDRHVAPRILACAASRSCCPGGPSGSRAAARRWRPACSRAMRPGDRQCVGSLPSIEAGLASTPTRRPFRRERGEQSFGAEQHGSGAVAQEGGPPPEIKLRHWASPDFKVFCLCAAAGGFETSIMLW